MIDKKYEFVTFAFLMGLFMSGFMSAVVTLINLGFAENFLSFWFEAYYKSFIIAFPTILVVVPIVRKIVARLIKH